MRTVTLVEAPTSAGGYAPGQENGPSALLDVGLIEQGCLLEIFQGTSFELRTH
jgi:hypothetical protein